jgi:hypothetical protein
MEPLLQDSAAKIDAARELLFASVDGYPGFDAAREFRALRNRANALE